MSTTIEPFTLAIPEAELTDLADRLSRIRWPSRETVSDISQGPPLAKLEELCRYWASEYDWRRCEELLNGLGQFKTEIDGLGIHFLHIRSPEPDAMPLLLTHGWPGSVLEFRDVIGPLTNPVAYGRNARDAFHLVIPSLPGFGFSDQPTGTGWDTGRIADAWATLMDRLGYSHWCAQGGDWGAAVTTTIGYKAPKGCIGIHLNFVMYQPTALEIQNATEDEQAMLASARRYDQFLSGYSKVQSTRPQTIGYALSDSPVALAAWIYGLFQDVSDSDGNPESVFSMDQMLDDIMLYWLPNAGASSARLYWEAMTSMSGGGGQMPPMAMPTAISMFPKEQVRLSRRWAEARFDNLVHFNELTVGGHFAALEQPALFTSELQASFRGLRR
jgi:epoxide hydrolase